MTEKKKAAEKAAKGAESPKEPSFRAEGRSFTQTEIVKVLVELGGVSLTSTQIRDKLGLKERDSVRGIMDKLVGAGVVTISQKPVKEGGERKRYYYTLIEEARR